MRAITPLHVALYIRTHTGSAPTVKQHLAAIRAIGDWLVVHQVLPANPVMKGATPVLKPAETRSLLDGIDQGSLVGLRDRALLSVMVYSFARASAVVGMRRQDYFLQGTRGWLRLHEKGGKRHDVPAHHRAEAAVEAYLVAGGVEEAKAPLFQSVDRSRRLSGRSLTRRVVLAMIKRRASASGLPASTCCHTFRATGITAYLDSARAYWQDAREGGAGAQLQMRAVRSLVVAVLAVVVLAVPAVVLADGRVALGGGQQHLRTHRAAAEPGQRRAGHVGGLRRLGFEVTTELDADRVELTRSVASVHAAARDPTVGVDISTTHLDAYRVPRRDSRR